MDFAIITIGCRVSGETSTRKHRKSLHLICNFCRFCPRTKMAIRNDFPQPHSHKSGRNDDHVLLSHDSCFSFPSICGWAPCEDGRCTLLLHIENVLSSTISCDSPRIMVWDNGLDSIHDGCHPESLPNYFGGSLSKSLRKRFPLTACDLAGKRAGGGLGGRIDVIFLSGVHFILICEGGKP